MRYLLTLLLVQFALLVTHAQSWSWVLQAQYLNYGSTDLEFTQFDRYERLSTALNYEVGIGVSHQLEKINLRAGVSFTNLSMRAVYNCDVCDFLVPPEPERLKLYYLTIPLQVEYRILDNNQWSLSPTIGLNVHIPMYQAVGSFSSHSSNTFTSISPGIELYRELNKSVGIGLIASYRWALGYPVELESSTFLVNGLTVPHDPQSWHNIGVGIRTNFTLR